MESIRDRTTLFLLLKPHIQVSNCETCAQSGSGRTYGHSHVENDVLETTGIDRIEWRVENAGRCG